MKKKLNHGTSKKRSVRTEDKPAETSEKPIVKADSLDDEDQGFGGWLKSTDGLETMKLFVIANSIVLLTTIVYPHLQTVSGIIYDMVYGEDALFPMFGLVARIVFVLAVIQWYSVNVWTMISDYFNREFNKFITNDSLINFDEEP